MTCECNRGVVPALPEDAYFRVWACVDWRAFCRFEPRGLRYAILYASNQYEIVCLFVLVAAATMLGFVFFFQGSFWNGVFWTTDMSPNAPVFPNKIQGANVFEE